MIDRYGDRFVLVEGGTGSGYFGHPGRPGARGGSVGVAGRAAKSIRADGGVTITTHGDVPHNGFAVAGITNDAGSRVEKIFARPVTERDVRAFMQANSALLAAPRAHVGGWIEGKQTYLDVVQRMRDRTAALGTARARNEIAIFDLKTKETIYTMSDKKRPSKSKGKFTEAERFTRKMLMIFGKDQTPEQIAKALNAARDSSV